MSSRSQRTTFDTNPAPQYDWQQVAAQQAHEESLLETKGVVVARVVAVLQHPNAQYIRLAVIDLGDGAEHRQVVYGGDRDLQPGDLVPAAPPGAVVPGKKRKLRKQKFRGERSYGMLCSADELGWTAGGPDRVAILDPDNLEAGQSLDTFPGRWPLIDQAELDMFPKTAICVDDGLDAELDDFADSPSLIGSGTQ